VNNGHTETLPPSLAELAGASRRTAQHVVDLGANRLELLGVELQEERERLVHSLVLILGAAALAMLAGFALTLAVLVALWDHSPLIAMAVLTFVYASGAIFLYLQFSRLQHGQMFSATFEQLRKDCQCFGTSLR
jgi:uncharacterized membrane protein YqjE